MSPSFKLSPFQPTTRLQIFPALSYQGRPIPYCTTQIPYMDEVESLLKIPSPFAVENLEHKVWGNPCWLDQAYVYSSDTGLRKHISNLNCPAPRTSTDVKHFEWSVYWCCEKLLSQGETADIMHLIHVLFWSVMLMKYRHTLTSCALSSFGLK